MRGLNLGCGRWPISSTKDITWVNVDISPTSKADEFYDITKGLHEEDESVDVVYTSHTLEHVPHGDGPVDLLIFVMNECWRVLKPGGILKIVVPSGYNAEWAMRDPTHRRAFFKGSFYYFTGEFPELSEDYGIRCNFTLINYEEKDNNIYVQLQRPL